MGDSIAERHLITIVGAGFAGIGLAIRLQQAGIDDFIILERGDEVGGTWRDNTYPGAACDVPSYLYSYSFEPNPYWTEYFAPSRDIEGYIKACVEKYQLAKKIRFGKEVNAARYDEAKSEWQLGCSSAETYASRYLVSAQGPLANPSLPDISGLKDFDGKVIHSARWDHDYDLKGKKVAVIGTGASAIQLVPAIAKTVDSMTVFQRTAPWIIPRANRVISSREKELYQKWPVLQWAHRWAIYIMTEFYGPFVFSNKASYKEKLANIAMRHMGRAVKNPELRKKLTPNYQIGCKRVLLANDYYPVFEQGLADLNVDGIERFTKTGIVTKTGEDISFDAVIFATGFEAATSGPSIPVIGRNKISLTEKWHDGAFAYKGMTVDDFPNLFFMVGPNTGPGHTSVLVFLETQINYFVKAVKWMQRRNKASLEVKTQIVSDYNEWIQKRMGKMIWTSGGCQSWYLTPGGKNTSLFPGFASDYCIRAARFNAGDYQIQ